MGTLLIGKIVLSASFSYFSWNLFQKLLLYGYLFVVSCMIMNSEKQYIIFPWLFLDAPLTHTPTFAFLYHYTE